MDGSRYDTSLGDDSFLENRDLVSTSPRLLSLTFYDFRYLHWRYKIYDLTFVVNIASRIIFIIEQRIMYYNR